MSESKSLASFCCQRCLQPIHLDESLNNLGEHTIADLALEIRHNNEADLELQASSLDHYVPPFRMTESGTGANGFMVISDGWETTSLGHQVHVKASLFDLLSNNSDVDHPLCDECTDTLLELMDNELKMAETEWKEYSDYLSKLEDDKEDLNLEGLQKELEDWKDEEARLLQELQALQKEEKAMKDDITEQEQEKERLKKEQDIYWREYTKYRKDLMVTEDQVKFYESQISYTQIQLEKLKKTNVFKLAFHISDSGQFGIINNFRLGRLPTAPVDWTEINAAWGQTVLLLSSLARKINFCFQRYRLVPYGNYSYVEVLEDQKHLPLYGSGGFRFLWDTKFDTGMVAFLDCLQQFKEQVEKGNTGFCLPYRIDKGKIEDTASPPHAYSIKIQFNSEEHWTKALKYMLTNLKWALTWISSQFSEDKSEDEDDFDDQEKSVNRDETDSRNPSLNQDRSEDQSAAQELTNAPGPSNTQGTPGTPKQTKVLKQTETQDQSNAKDQPEAQHLSENQDKSNQDKAEIQGKSETQDKSEIQDTSENQDKSETMVKSEIQDKSDNQSKSEIQDESEKQDKSETQVKSEIKDESDIQSKSEIQDESVEQDKSETRVKSEIKDKSDNQSKSEIQDESEDQNKFGNQDK